MISNELQRNIEHVERLIDRPSLSADVFGRVLDALSEVRGDMDLIDSEDGYERHLRQYVATSESSCGCSAPNCELKRGMLPSEIVLDDDMAGACDRYITTHPQPIVLMDARDAFMDRVNRVEDTYRRCVAALTSDSTDYLD